MQNVRWLGVIGNVNIQYSAYDFPFAFKRKYVFILYSYLSKVADKSTKQHLMPTPNWDWPTLNFTKIFGTRKLVLVWQCLGIQPFQQNTNKWWTDKHTMTAYCPVVRSCLYFGRNSCAAATCMTTVTQLMLTIMSNWRAVTHTHTHNRFTALLESVRDYPGEQVPER